MDKSVRFFHLGCYVGIRRPYENAVTSMSAAKNPRNNE